GRPLILASLSILPLLSSSSRNKSNHSRPILSSFSSLLRTKKPSGFSPPPSSSSTFPSRENQNRNLNRLSTAAPLSFLLSVSQGDRSRRVKSA
ncbi:unnamed protein product, partial [Linum tenue]